MTARDPSDRSGAEALHATAHAEAPVEAPTEWIGRVLDDRYRVTSVLGEGGMGAVYVAQHLTLHKEVALKVIRAELAGNGEVATRFAREAMATAQFEHPHVASAIDYGTLPEGGAYFVMQLVRGRSLRAMLHRERSLPWRRASLLAAQVADALSSAKAAGIIHRDLKPDNILVESREDGSDLAKVLDFGIAHVAPRDAPAPEGAMADRQLTRVGTIMGTPGYMPPEQAVGDTVDHRADLYALGVVLWESIAGRELWDAPDLTATITRQMSQPVPLLREEVDLAIPAALDSLLQSLIAREPADRPDHAGAVRDELRRLAHAEPQSRATLAFIPALRDAVVPAVSTVVSRFRTQPRAQKLRLLSGGVGAIALLLAITFASPNTANPPAGPDAAASTTDDAEADNADSPQDPTRAAQAKAKPSALAKAVAAAGEAVQPAIDAARGALPGDGLPEALRPSVEAMQHGDSLRARREGASRVLAHEPRAEVPAHLVAIAKFMNARGCRPRRQAIEAMAKAPHPAYLGPLWQMRRAPKTGCGFLSLSDCYGCVRSDLRAAITKIGTAYPKQGEGEALAGE